MRVLVTGGAGFIGANLCRHLAARAGFGPITALDDLSTGFSGNLEGADGVELVQDSILNFPVLSDLVAASDVVVHLAARPSVPRSVADPVATHKVNVNGTINVLEAARRAGRRQVIFASSSSVYGANPALPKHEDLLPMPVSPYAASKACGEAYLRAYSSVFDVDALVFRFFNVFGPLQPADHSYAAVVPAFVSAALESRPLPVHGSGTQTRDFTFVGTVVSVITEAIERRVVHPGPVNLAFGSRVSLLELIGVLEGLLDRPLPRQQLPTRAGDVADSQADQHLLRSLFPDVQPLALADGLDATVRWYRDRLSGTASAGKE